MSIERGKEKPSVIIGVGVVVKNTDGELLMIKRKGTHGEGEWAFPGGRVEYGEDFVEAAYRELREELSLEGSRGKVISLSNQTRYLDEGIHCVIIGVEMSVDDLANIQINEPEKCEEFGWFTLDNLPTNIFEGSGQTVKVLRGEGKDIKYFE